MSEPNLVPITDVNIDINDVAERMFLGPQGELVERIERFNSRYGHWTDGDIIKITKGFKFKPGTYDRIKEAHGKYVLRYYQKASSIWSLADRISRHNYLNRSFWDDAKVIQRSMKELTWHNVTWQENTEVVERFWNEFMERLQAELTEANDRFPDSQVHISIDENILNDRDNWKAMKIYIDVTTKDINMKVYHLDEVISEYEWGSIINRWQVPIWSFLNNWCEGGRNNPTGSFGSNPVSKIFPKYIGLRHPYISRHYNELRSEWIGSSCTGDNQSAIGRSVWALNIMPLIVNVRNWLSKYHIPNTNPLNRISKCYYGMPPGSTQKLWQHRGDSSPIREMDNCVWPSTYRNKLSTHTNHDTGLKYIAADDELVNNPCDECQFADNYPYEGIIKNEPATIEAPPCPYAISDYMGPETETDAIKEACIIHMMTCSVMRRFQNQMYDAGLVDILIDESNRFPKDAEFSNIFDILGEDFHLEYYFETECDNWGRQDHESLLDVVFNTRMWHDLINELGSLHFGSPADPEDMEVLESDWRSATLEELRAEIERIRLNIENHDSEMQLINEAREVNLTPEERTIRWVTQNGSSINI